MLYAQAMQSGRKRGMKVKDEWERGKRGEERRGGVLGVWAEGGRGPWRSAGGRLKARFLSLDNCRLGDALMQPRATA